MSLTQAYRLAHRAGIILDARTVLALVRYRSLKQRFYDDLWRQAAANVGAEVTPWRSGFLRIQRDGLTTVVKQSRVMLDDQITLNLMGNKALTYDLLTEKGYRVPAHCVFTMDAITDAVEFFDRQGGQVVVKPAAGTGAGRGITTLISSTGELKSAARIAARYADTLIVEEQVEGASYRLLYLGGEFIDAIRRDAPTIIGDGRHTIAALMAEENRARLTANPIRALNPLLVDRDCINKLRALGLSQRLRPESGRRIAVKQAINQNSAAENHSVRDEIHPQIIEMGARLVRDLGVQLAGLDLMSSDIGVPLGQSGSHFNEVNTTPGLHHHHLISDPGRRVGVAELILEHLFTRRVGVMRI